MNASRDSFPPGPATTSGSYRRRVLVAGGFILLIMIAAGAFIARHQLRKFREAHLQIIGSFAEDFQEAKPKENWRYLWNANGPIGCASNYVALRWNGALYTATGAEEYPQPGRAHYLRLARGSGHPGQGPAQGHGDASFDEDFVIIGFVVPASGSYRISKSSIARRADTKQGNIHVRVFVNDNETGTPMNCRSKEGVSFDRRLGRLSAGDTVYVTIGPDETDLNDSFDIDFAIAR